MNDEELKALQQRNNERAAATIAAMGTKYACHAVNVVKRDPVRARFMPKHIQVISAPVTLLRRGGVK